MREFEHLARHRAFAAVHARDAVAERHHGADFGHIDVDREAANLLADDLGNFVGLDAHRLLFVDQLPFSTSCWRIFSSCVLMLPS